MGPALQQLSPASIERSATATGRRAPRGARRGGVLSWRPLRDPYVGYTAGIAPIALVVGALGGRPLVIAGIVGASVVLIGVQLALGSVPAARRPVSALAWSFVRLLATLFYVTLLVMLTGGASGPMAALLLPLVVAAAALGTVQAVVMGAVATMIYLAPELVLMGSSTDLALRGITLAGISILLALGTRRLVATLERTSRKLRFAILAERRRSRQIAAMEEVSRRLTAGGPTQELLDHALDVLFDRFGYHHVSIYLADGDRIVLGAQRGYERAIPAFDGSAGVVGRVMRGRRLEFVTDVRADSDYIQVFDGMRSEICAPLLVDGRFLGILNVESREPLERADRDLVASLADRLATVVALDQDRQALAQRGAVFRRLHEFTQAVSGTLQLDRLAEAVAGATSRVVPADLVALTVVDRASGRFQVRAIGGVEGAQPGKEVAVGEGLAGRAIRDRAMVIDEEFTPDEYPAAYRELAPASAVLGAGIPLVRDGVVVGALTIVRHDRSRGFAPVEREAMELLAGHTALAITNAFLHADLEELAIRDPLTGIYNRRYFDETLDRIIAAWHRTDAAARRPISAILFDLDHFGDFNKRHGHQVGDRVLRSFAELLGDRFRASDLVARLGGEEFMVVLEGADTEAAAQLADEVRAALGDLALASDDGAALSVTVSAGCAVLTEQRATRAQLLRDADVALFVAKREGRNRVAAA